MITRVSLAMQSAGMAHFLRCPTCASCLPPSLQAGAPRDSHGVGESFMRTASSSREQGCLLPASAEWWGGAHFLVDLPDLHPQAGASTWHQLSWVWACHVPVSTGVTWAVNQAETHYNFLCLVASYLSLYLSFGRGGCEAICLFLLEPVAEKCLFRFTQLSGYPQPGPPCACPAQGLRFLLPTPYKRCLSCYLMIKEWASPTETSWKNPGHRL